MRTTWRTRSASTTSSSSSVRVCPLKGLRVKQVIAVAIGYLLGNVVLAAVEQQKGKARLDAFNRKAMKAMSTWEEVYS